MIIDAQNREAAANERAATAGIALEAAAMGGVLIRSRRQTTRRDAGGV